MATPRKPKKGMTLAKQMDFFVHDSAVFNDDESPFSAHLEPGDPKIFVIVGDNASGKSLLVRFAEAHVRADWAEHVDKPNPNLTISIRERTAPGLHRVFMFGEERTSSTGAIGVGSIDGAFRNMSDRTGVLILDEPEMGLSEAYAAAMGRFIAQSYQALPDGVAGVCIVSHSRPLLRALASELAVKPSFIRTGSREAITLDEWLDLDEQRSVDDLMSLRETAHQNFVTISKLYNL